MEIESKLLISKGWRIGGWRVTSIAYGFWGEGYENVLKLERGDGCTTLRIY